MRGDGGEMKKDGRLVKRGCGARSHTGDPESLAHGACAPRFYTVRCSIHHPVFPPDWVSSLYMGARDRKVTIIRLISLV